MTTPSITVQTRPTNGCARCVWWLQRQPSPWGLCTVHRVKTWWQHAACVEYERDVHVLDRIQIQNKEP